MKEIMLNVASLISVTSLIIPTKYGSFFWYKEAPSTQKNPSGTFRRGTNMHIKDGYINGIINVIAVPIMNRDGSVDKVTLENG
jgi:hypothetical protein